MIPEAVIQALTAAKPTLAAAVAQPGKGPQAAVSGTLAALKAF